MMTINILIGPKMGDLFHMLIVPKYYYHFFNIKTNLYIVEKYDKFITSLNDTYEQLEPIIKAQEWCNSFKIYKYQAHIDVDLNSFRWNGLWATRPFWAVFLHTAFPNQPLAPKNFASIKWTKNNDYSDTLVVSRRDIFPFNDFVKEQYLSVFEKFDKKIFMAYDPSQYEAFPLKDKIDLVVVKNLSEQLEILNGSKMNLLNCSGPLCMASALNAPRIIETGEWMVPVYGYDYMSYDNVETFDCNQIFSPNTKYLNPNILSKIV